MIELRPNLDILTAFSLKRIFLMFINLTDGASSQFDKKNKDDNIHK